ncbi:MAG: LysE family translocator [Mangrovicoccus sp.]|nr:LysE family translocator [Mangrovicoccus sp.]
MSWALWLSFVTVSALNIVTPGPANLNMMRRAVQLGANRVVPTIFGNAFGIVVGASACAAALGSVLIAAEDNGQILASFRWLGVGYLALLGIRLMAKSEPFALHGRGECLVNGWGLYVEAFLLSVSNPKALLFYMVLFPQMIDFEKDLLPQVSLLILTYCCLSIFSLSTYSAAAHYFSARFFTQARFDRFRQVSGTILLCYSLKLLVDIQ